MSSNWMKFKHPAGHVVSVGACHRDPPDLAAPSYSAARWQPDGLPPFVDLCAHLTPVEDQGHAGSCTANALAGAYEYLEKRTLDVDGRVSRLFVYWNERDLKGETDKDCGANLGLGIQSLQNAGACSEEIWPYDLDNLFASPPDEAFAAGKEHTIDEAHKVTIDLHDMRHCLAEGYPFVFGLGLFDSFEKDGHNAHGRISMPTARSKAAGGHAMLCVGYSDKDKAFVVRNSWGEKWGDEGYCYIPYDYLGNAKYSHDLWTLRRAHNLDFTEGIAKDAPSSFYEDDPVSVQVPEDAPASEEEQPVEDPPAEDPPAEDPPAEDPPAEEPPAEEAPPAEDPPAEEQQSLGELGKDLEQLGDALKDLESSLFGKKR